MLSVKGLLQWLPEYPGEMMSNCVHQRPPCPPLRFQDSLEGLTGLRKLFTHTYSWLQRSDIKISKGKRCGRQSLGDKFLVVLSLQSHTGRAEVSQQRQITARTNYCQSGKLTGALVSQVFVKGQWHRHVMPMSLTLTTQYSSTPLEVKLTQHGLASQSNQNWNSLWVTLLIYLGSPSSKV